MVCEKNNNRTIIYLEQMQEAKSATCHSTIEF